MSTNEYMISLDNWLDNLFKKNVPTDIIVIILAVILGLALTALVIFISYKVYYIIDDIKIQKGK